MRLFLLVALTMTAFAANSLLNRVAVAGDMAGPAAFAAIRVLSGAVVLCLIARPKGLFEARRLVPALSITLYFVGFSFAYRSLDAGVGALILFGCVQVTMFGGSLLGGERPAVLRWVGMVLGLTGLAFLVLPVGGVRIDPFGAVLMAAAGIGWGIYSLSGRGSTAPIPDTAASFVLAAPLVVLAWGASGEGLDLAPMGVVYGVISGVVMSGLGYALWYSVLPRLGASVAALAQLTVPVIAVAGGALFLGEAVDLRTVLSAALVVGGVALGIAASRRA